MYLAQTLVPLSADGDFSYVVVARCLNRCFLTSPSVGWSPQYTLHIKIYTAVFLRIDSPSPFFLVQFNPVTQMLCAGQVKQY